MFNGFYEEMRKFCPCSKDLNKDLISYLGLEQYAKADATANFVVFQYALELPKKLSVTHISILLPFCDSSD